MTRSAGFLVLGLAVLCAPACGRKGPLRLPLSPRPQAVRNLSARQRGTSVVLEWTNPERSVDGRPLRSFAGAELWALALGPGGANKVLKTGEFESRARLVGRIAAKELPPPSPGSSGESAATTFTYRIAGDRFHPGALAFSVRILDEEKRPSEFSPPVPVDLRICPLPPEIQEIRVFEDRIEVLWAPPPGNIDGSTPARVSGYMVYRTAGDGTLEKLTPQATRGLVFDDRRFMFGVHYTYIVRACAAGTDPSLESDDSGPRGVVPRDTFPPAPPSDLVVLAGTNVISLSWQANREEDLAGYKIWRKEAGGSGFVSLTPGPVPENAYTDTSVEKGKTYVYAVSALDKTGNESAKTESRPVSLKGNGA